MALLHGGDYDPDPGDSIRLHKKDDSGRSSHKVRLVKTDEKGNRWIDIPRGFTKGDAVYLLQTKSMSKRYKRILPQDLAQFRLQPGSERLPILDLTPLEKNELNWFPEGLYVQVSTVSDAFVVQGFHPVRVIIELNSETSYDLLKKDTPEKPLLPYSKKTVFISLDPFVPEGVLGDLESKINTLIEKGFTNFVVNNLAHVNILKSKHDKNIHMIAGPYLYTFNKWAVSFLENLNIMALHTPAENSQDNLEECFEGKERSRVLVSVFSYPTLFRMRFKLPKDYDFTYFSDKESVGFKVNSTEDGSFVMSEYPFSLLDKMDVLKNRGWTHQLIDFSKTRVLKSDIKDMLSIIQKREFIPGASRFNWKDGFFNPEKMEAYKAISQQQKLNAAPKKNGRRK